MTEVSQTYSFVDASIRARRNAAKARLSMFVSVALMAVGVAAAFIAAYVYLQIAQLAYTYGWGQIPPEQYPVPPEAIEEFFIDLDWVVLASFVGGAFAALFSMSFARWGIEAVIGKPSFYFTWGWTIGAIFIPLVCLYRPWVGFGEVRRAAVGIASRQRISQEWQGDGFSIDTLLFGFVWLFTLASLRVLATQIELEVTSGQLGLATLERITKYLFVGAGLRLSVLIITGWYLSKIARSVREVSEIARRAQTFE
jgi:hypothetical protein